MSKIDTVKLLRSMTEIMSVTGFERKGGDALRALVAPYFDENYCDRTGNHIFIKRCNRKNPKKILLDAHFDEIGMMVTEIHEGGFISFAPVGGFDRGILPAGEVYIYGEKTIYGVICATPPHLQKPGDAEKLPEMADMLIDTGYDKEELEKIVKIGTPIGFYCNGGELKGCRIRGRGFDDKSCGAALISAVASCERENLSADIYVAISAREEIGGEGPMLAAFDIRPDAALVADVNFARTPGTEKHETIEYGKGAGLSLTATCNRALSRRIIEVAKEKEIPLSLVAEGTDMGTNAAYLQLAMEGIPCVALSLPLGNMHTYNEALDKRDLEALSDLVSALICDGGIICGEAEK